MMRTIAARADGDLIDVLRSDLRLHDERIGARHDLHNGFAVADHAADGMHGKLVDEAVLRRADVDALELIFRRRHALLELGDLALGLAQVLEHLGAEILVELDDLQFGFADLAAGARDLRDDTGPLALSRALSRCNCVKREIETRFLV